MNWKLAHEFVRHWFGDSDDVVLLSGLEKKRISLPASTLLTRFDTGKDKGFDVLASTLKGVVQVYPWLKLADDGNTTPLHHSTHLTLHEWRHPGYWVDLPLSISPSSVDMLCRHLDGVGMTPTMLTGLQVAETDLIRQGRLWWRFDTQQVAVSADAFLHDQCRWQWFIQSLAIEHGIFTHMSIRDPKFVGLMQTPLPGTVYQGKEVVMVPYRDVDDPVKYHSIVWHRDWNDYADGHSATYEEVHEWATSVDFLSEKFDRRFNTLFKTWDDILVPQHWRVLSTATDPDDGALVTWWTAPGASGPTAFTKSVGELRLYDATWLSGLKEESDHGVVLTRTRAACLLWWDGDVDAMNMDVMSGRKLPGI